MKYVAIIAGCFILLANLLLHAVVGQPVALRSALWTAAIWLLWVALAPVIVRMATVVRYRRRARWRFFLVHTAAALALTAVHLTAYLLLRIVVYGRTGGRGQALGDVLLMWMPFAVSLGLLVYGGTVLAVSGTFYLQAAAKREEERQGLERWLAQAELDLYRLRLPPGVVVARLDEIERTIARDPDRAELLIEEFGAFLRESLLAVNVSADAAQIAYDEDELEEELPPALPMWLRVVLLLGITPAIHLLHGVLFAASAAARGQPMRFELWPYVFRGSLLLLPATLLLVWLGAKMRRLWLLAVVSATLPFFWVIAITTVVDGAKEARAAFLDGNPPVDFLIFFGIALGTFTHARYRTARVAAVAVAQLESQVLRTRATILRLQLNPHFLFNTLNSVAALLEDDPAAATVMAAQLRQFVVRVLETTDRERVPLAEELDALHDYVAIQNVRFNGRVELAIEAPDEARHALVPGFLLQPLVENALRHGLLPESGGCVSVLAAVHDGALQIAVSDDGRSSDGERPVTEGLGLSNTRARLAQLYGDRFVLETAAGGDGFRVTLSMPFEPGAALYEN